MYRQLPNRNQRLRGFRVKDVLKIVLLLAVCIWLLYQIKHYHDKKKAFDESNSKLSEKMENKEAVLIFGRKGLRPRVKESVSTNEGQIDKEDIEEEENKNIEGKNRKEEEEEGEESKHEENEDESRDDEMDEQDREEAEDIADMEQSLEEDEFEQTREEQYNGDDASSAVVRDTQVLNTETKNGTTETHAVELVENLEGNGLGLRNKTSNNEMVISDQNASNLKTEDGEMVEDNVTVNATSGDGKGSDITLSESENGLQPNSSTKAEPIHITLSESENGLQPNSSTKAEPIDQPEVNNNSTSQNAGIPISSIQNGTYTTNNQTVVVSLSNAGDSKPQTVSDEQTENSNTTTETVESGSKSPLSTTSENVDASNAQSAEEQAVKSDTTAGAEDTSVSLVKNENGNGHQKVEAERTVGTEEAEDNSSSSTTNENPDSVDIKVVDSNDSLILQVSEARTDLGTLPETVTEGTKSKQRRRS